MSNLNDNDFEGFEEEPTGQPAPSPSGGGNRTFLTALGVIGIIFVLAVAAVVVFALFVLPQRNASRVNTAAQINAQNTATALAATQQMAAALAKPSATALVAKVVATSTPVVAIASKTPTLAATAVSTQGVQVGAGDPVARTATVAALLTQAAGASGNPAARTATVSALLTQAAKGTVVATPKATSTALPSTGFADEVGLPGLLGLAALLIVVVFAARRMRLANQ